MNNVNRKVVQKMFDEIVKHTDQYDLDTVFNCKIGDYTFDVAPFLCIASTLESYESDITTAFGSNMVKALKKTDLEDLYETLYLDRSEFREHLNLSSPELLQYFYTAVDEDVPTNFYASLWLWKKQPANFLKYALVRNSQVLLDLLWGILEFDYFTVDESVKDFSNLQAFSFYIGIYWLYELCPQIRVYFGKYLRNINLKEVLLGFIKPNTPLDYYLRQSDELIPSIRKYFGVISDTDDDVKITEKHKCFTFMRDRYLYMSGGRYLITEDIDVELCKILYRQFTYEMDKAYKTSLLAMMYILLKKDDDKRSLFTLTTDLKALAENNNTLKDEIVDLRDRLTKRDQKIQELTKENRELKHELASVEDVSSIEQKLDEVKETLRLTRIDNDDIYTELCRLRQENSYLKKRVPDDVVEIMDSVLEQEEQFDYSIPLESKVEALKDLSLAIIGSDFISNTTKRKFEDLGLVNVNIYTDSKQTPTRFDYMVVLSTRCNHATENRIAKFMPKFDAERIIVSQSNVEYIVDAVYKHHLERIE